MVKDIKKAKIKDIVIRHLSAILGDFKGEKWSPINEDATFLFVKGAKDGAPAVATSLSRDQVDTIVDAAVKADATTSTTIGEVVRKAARTPVDSSEAQQRGRTARGQALAPIFTMRTSRVPTKEQIDAAGGGVVGLLRAARALNNGE